MAATDPGDNADRGRGATQPRQIPQPGWRDILLRVKYQLDKDNLSLIASGVAFYALLALVPALTAFVSLYGLVMESTDVEGQLSLVTGILPQEARQILTGQLQNIVASSDTALSIGALFGMLLAVWSATKGTAALITALNIVYGEAEGRGFFKLKAITLLLTLGALIFGILTLSLVAGLPALLGILGLEDETRLLVSLVRWPALGLFIIVALSILYRFAPDRSQAKWRWVSWGAVAATALWLGGSALFSLYVSNFASYNETYGSLGAVVILLMWLFLTAYAVLLGAELNAEMEHQTKKDTTTGAARPMGERGAYVADTVGKRP